MACAALAGTVVSPGAWAGTEAKAKPKSKHTTSTTQLSGATSKQLKSITSSLGKAEKRTFKAVYSFVGNGTSQSVTIEQQPPKSRYSFGSNGSVIDTGTATYFCSTSGGQVTCIPESGGSNPPQLPPRSVQPSHRADVPASHRVGARREGPGLHGVVLQGNVRRTGLEVREGVGSQRQWEVLRDERGNPGLPDLGQRRLHADQLLGFRSQ